METMLRAKLIRGTKYLTSNDELHLAGVILRQYAVSVKYCIYTQYVHGAMNYLDHFSFY